MSVKERKIRGLRDIRTNVDRIDQFVAPYKGYLRIGSLEMERARKLVERGNLAERLRVIEERCRQLDAEKKLIMRIIDDQAVSQGSNKMVIPVARPVRKTDVDEHINATKYPKKPAALDRGSDKNQPEKTRSETAVKLSSLTNGPGSSAEMKPGAAGFKIRY